MDVAQTVPRLREILKSLPEEQKEVLRKQIEKMVQLLDPGSAPRKAYEDLLKEP
jgi:DNA-binding transcriptional regulator GbsR (MarR family)